MVNGFSRRCLQAPGFGRGIPVDSTTLDGDGYFAVSEMEVFAVA
jgi:hypothetical protein